MKPNFKNLIPKEEALEKIFNIFGIPFPKADIVILNAGTSKGGEDYCVKF